VRDWFQVLTKALASVGVPAGALQLAMVFSLAQPSLGGGVSKTGGEAEPPESDLEGLARVSTSQGDVAVELAVNRESVRVGERLDFRLVNRGEVTLIAGQSFTVEHWDGNAWTATSEPIITTFGGTEFRFAFTEEGRLLSIGQHSDWQMWRPNATRHASGWYRIAKSVWHRSDLAERPNVELVARTRFYVYR
jgi:hypothetical protein